MYTVLQKQLYVVIQLNSHSLAFYSVTISGNSIKKKK